METTRYNFAKPVKSNGTPWPDTRDYDGVLASGWRRVTKKGTILFSKNVFFHEKLLDYNGFWVFVERKDFTGDTITVYPHFTAESSIYFQCTSVKSKQIIESIPGY